MTTDLTPDLLERLGSLLRAETRSEAAMHGLQPVHVDLLRYLSRCNRYSNTPAALARFLHSTKGTVSQSLKLLEQKGLVSRIADATDRRVVRLKLARKGERLLALLEDGAAVRDAIGSMSQTRRRELERSLREVLQQAQQANDLRTFGQCRTCRFFRRHAAGAYQCGLTGEALTDDDSRKICIEHETSTTG